MKLKRGIVYKIDFEDHGQGFTSWYVKNRIVIDCEPGQARAWNGTKVRTNPELGMLLPIYTRTGRPMTLEFPIVTVMFLDEEQAKEPEANFRNWLQEVENE